MIETRPGDVFYYEGLANIKGDDAAAFLNIGAFDEQRKVVDWNLYKKKADRINQWIRVQNTITISDPNIRFITFRLVGTGRGEFRFDDIRLKKLAGGKQKQVDNNLFLIDNFSDGFGNFIFCHRFQKKIFKTDLHGFLGRNGCTETGT